MAKVGRNDPCPCGSKKKFKKCCWLKSAGSQASNIHPIRVIREITPSRQETFHIELNAKSPFDVYFDTNVWRSMNSADMETLKRLGAQYGFRYRYSITNYAEFMSHLTEPPSKEWPNPLAIVKASFRRILDLCEPEVLSSPEMEFLATAGLDHYIDPVWIPNATHTAAAVLVVAEANSLEEIRGERPQAASAAGLPRWIIEPSHYKTLREVDGKSMQFAMSRLPKVSKPLNKDFSDQITAWFLTLASFFLLIRPSCKKVGFKTLTNDERNRFVGAFTKGCGRVFAQHCKYVAQRTLLQGKKVDRNDLYDMLQLLLLHDSSRIFVTNEKAFFGYGLEPELQRVVRWEGFRRSG